MYDVRTVLDGVVDARRVRALPALQNLKTPWGTLGEGDTLLFRPAEENRTVPSVEFGRPLATVAILLASSMTMLFCRNWWALLYATAVAGSVGPNARTRRGAAKLIAN